MESSGVWDEVWSRQKDDTGFRWWLKRETNGVRGKKIISYIERYAGSIKGLKMVEAGAGSGVYSMLFAQHGAEVTLLDYSKEALMFAQRNFSFSGILASYLHTDILNLNPGLQEKFDVAFSFGTVEHFRYPQRFWAAKAHVDLVRPGGIIIISVPNILFFPHEILKILLQKKGKWHLGYEGALSRTELFRLGKKLGLNDMKIRGSAFITDIFSYLYILQKSSFLKKIFPKNFLNLTTGDIASFFDDLFGADIFLMGHKSP